LTSSSTASRVDTRECVASATLEGVHQLTLRASNPARLVPERPPVGLWGVQSFGGTTRRQLTLLAGVAKFADAFSVVPVAFTGRVVAASRTITEFTARARVLDRTLVTGALSRVGVTFTLAGAVVRTVGVLARMSEVRLLARARTRFWDAGTMTVASVTAVVRVHDAIAVRAFTSLARTVYLLSVRCDAPVCFRACADASDFVECTAVATFVIDCSCLH